jgi:hypothetical protein
MHYLPRVSDALYMSRRRTETQPHAKKMPVSRCLPVALISLCLFLFLFLCVSHSLMSFFSLREKRVVWKIHACRPARGLRRVLVTCCIFLGRHFPSGKAGLSSGDEGQHREIKHTGNEGSSVQASLCPLHAAGRAFPAILPQISAKISKLTKVTEYSTLSECLL